MASGGNPFISGNWAPVPSEVAQPAPCAVTVGALPRDLRGSFLRVGPNPRRAPANPKTYHFFSGDGMVHGVELGDGRAAYRRRFVRTPHCLSGAEETEDGERGGLANTALVFQAGRLLALEEGSKPWHLSLPSLETLGRFTFGGRLRHNFTAHPKVLPTGEMVLFGYGAHQVEGSSAHVHASTVDAAGELERTVAVNFRRPMMAHDMAVTANYTIMMDFPLWSMSRPTRVEDRSRFGVMLRGATDESEVQWFDGEGLYGYHTANCWERPRNADGSGGTLIELIMVAALGFSFSRSNANSLKLRRWIFDLKSGETIEEAELSQVPCEFPVIDQRRVGMPCRFVYASRLTTAFREPLPVDAWIRHDLQTGETLSVDLPGGRRGGEVQFVPRRLGDGSVGSARGEEGDGYVLMLATGPEASTGDLLVFDATTTEVLAVVDTGHRVPHGFHALWVDEEKYREHSHSEAPRARL